jgi:hypothetical protein
VGAFISRQGTRLMLRFGLKNPLVDSPFTPASGASKNKHSFTRIQVYSTRWPSTRMASASPFSKPYSEG